MLEGGGELSTWGLGWWGRGSRSLGGQACHINQVMPCWKCPYKDAPISQMTERPSIVFTGKIDTTLVFVGLSVGDSIVNCFT